MLADEELDARLPDDNWRAHVRMLRQQLAAARRDAREVPALRAQVAELEALPETRRAKAAIALANRIATGPGGGPSYAVNEIEDYLAACPQVAGEGKGASQ